MAHKGWMRADTKGTDLTRWAGVTMADFAMYQPKRRLGRPIENKAARETITCQSARASGLYCTQRRPVFVLKIDRMDGLHGFEGGHDGFQWARP